MKPYAIGESCLCWPMGTDISAATSGGVLRVYKALKLMPARTELGILDVVPSYNALAVYFDPLCADARRIEEAVQELMERQAGESGDVSAGKEATLPVRYNGPDIGRVAEHNGLSREKVIELHAGGRYVVAMIGFLPHFPYLIGLSERLATPRLASPRKRVPAGSVAIGGAQTGVYPKDSPGGWNIIGATDPERLMPLEPGDRVLFEKL